MSDAWSHWEKDVWMIKEANFGVTPSASANWFKPGSHMKVSFPPEVHIEPVRGPGNRRPYGGSKGGNELKVGLEFDAWGDTGWKTLLRGAIGSDTVPAEPIPSFSMAIRYKRTGDTDAMFVLLSGGKINTAKLTVDRQGLAPLRMQLEFLFQMHQENEYAIENAVAAWTMVGFQGTVGVPVLLLNTGTPPGDPATDPLMWHAMTSLTYNIGGGVVALAGVLKLEVQVSNNLVPESGVLTGADTLSYATRHATLHEGTQEIVIDITQLEQYEDPDTVTSDPPNDIYKAYVNHTEISALVITIIDSAAASRTVTLTNGHITSPQLSVDSGDAGPSIQPWSAFFETATLALS